MYLAVAKQKKPGYKKIRKAIGQQLRYLRRNLRTIDRMAKEGLLKYLSKRLYRLLLVIKYESCDLIEQIRRYRERFGFYP